MYVVEGRLADAEQDWAVTEQLATLVGNSHQDVLRVWQPPRAVAFGPREYRRPGIDDAIAVAKDRGYPPRKRTVGGHAVAITEGTLAMAYLVPITDSRRGIGQRYADARERVGHALETIGVVTTHASPPKSFCPGQHALCVDGKLAGFAQRVRADVALTAGIIIITDCEEFVRLTDAIYRALGLSFDPDSVDSIERAAGIHSIDPVKTAIEATYAAEADTVYRLSIEDLPEPADAT